MNATANGEEVARAECSLEQVLGELRHFVRKWLVRGEGLSPQEMEDYEFFLAKAKFIRKEFGNASSGADVVSERELVKMIFGDLLKSRGQCDCPKCRKPEH